MKNDHDIESNIDNDNYFEQFEGINSMYNTIIQIKSITL